MNVELDDSELEWVASRVAAELMTYLGHAMSDGLFPKEQKRMEWLQKFSDKLTKLSGAGKEPL